MSLEHSFPVPFLIMINAVFGKRVFDISTISKLLKSAIIFLNLPLNMF